MKTQYATLLSALALTAACSSETTDDANEETDSSTGGASTTTTGGTGTIGTGGTTTVGTGGTGTIATGGTGTIATGGTTPVGSGDLCPGAFPADVGTFVADADGVIVMEAESVSLVGNWTAGTEFAGYSGASYIYSTTGSQDELNYTFQIDTPGTYRMSFHNYIDHPDNFTEHNDVFTIMDGGLEIKTFSHGDASVHNWNWDTGLDPEGATLDPALYVQGGGFIRPPGYIFTAGEHTLTVVGRSPDFLIDRIHIYPDGTAEGVALDTARPQSGQINCQ